jgi:predicted DCC family thiol-disulfide oxidoreductase YuxK
MNTADRPPPGSPAIVFFDGVCGLCNRGIDFLLRHDRHHRLRFAPLQGATARRELGAAADDLDTVVFLCGGHRHARSTAVLQIARQLGGLWRLAGALLIIPAPWRDALYAFIVRRRYRWYGRRDACRLPTPAERNWFLD